MRKRREGAPGSFSAPIEEIVAEFPTERVRTRRTGEEVDAAPPRLRGEDLAQSLRAAFLLNEFLEKQNVRDQLR